MSVAVKISPPEMTGVVHYEDGSLEDIQEVLMEVINKDLGSQVEEFAKRMRRDAGSDYAFLRQLWNFCKYQIRYKKDPAGLQLIKQPARLWAEREGDCKSLTVFIYHCCRVVGIPCIIRFASYNRNKRIQHVYPVAVLKDRQVPVDAVWDYFDDEENATKIEDRMPKAWQDSINGIPAGVNWKDLIGLVALAIIAR
ncbi:MAG: hypothetical protein D6706_21510 [Chloroflexi bacterium]|nr:MAG: hypothetical protein D6706_21510 [Chloroflexota bacterium]